MKYKITVSILADGKWNSLHIMQLCVLGGRGGGEGGEERRGEERRGEERRGEEEKRRGGEEERRREGGEGREEEEERKREEEEGEERKRDEGEGRQGRSKREKSKEEKGERDVRGGMGPLSSSKVNFMQPCLHPIYGRGTQHSPPPTLRVQGRPKATPKQSYHNRTPSFYHSSNTHTQPHA